MNQKPDRTEKLKDKLRASEAARVAAVRRADLARKRVIELSREVADLKAANKRRVYEISKLEAEADSLREKVPHVGARVVIGKMETQLAALKLWTEENCTCGGDGPDAGCLACQAYHAAGLGGGE